VPELVRVTRAGGIATVTMNRPDARNALSPALIEGLDGAVAGVEGDASARVMVLAGEGPAFCAGMDVKDVMSDPPGMRRMLHGLARVTLRIRRLPIPTIARVQGAAVGGGCGLMVVCDLALTHPEARLGYPEVSLGLCPAVVAPWLIRRIGAGRARAMLLSGGTMGGDEGHRLGLVPHLAPRDKLEAEAGRLASLLAEGGRQAMAVTKRWLNELDGSLDEGMLLRGADLSADVIAGEEAQTRLRARFGGP
jgi:enoyl-CoA hydratase/carnithine racemase